MAHENHQTSKNSNETGIQNICMNMGKEHLQCLDIEIKTCKLHVHCHYSIFSCSDLFADCIVF